MTLSPLSDAEVERLEALAAKASSGPWEFHDAVECQIRPHVRQVLPNGKRYTICTPVHSNLVTEQNMQFIAESRDALPRLLAALREEREHTKATLQTALDAHARVCAEAAQLRNVVSKAAAKVAMGERVKLSDLTALVGRAGEKNG